MIYENLINEVSVEFPKFKIVKKTNSFFMKIIGFLLFLFSFGKNRSFMDLYTTTIGVTVYVPDNWNRWSDKSRVEILSHERIHMRQATKYGKLKFSFGYLFWPFPILWSSFRTKMEMEAYCESLRIKYEYDPTIFENLKLKEYIFYQFTGPMYGWMCRDNNKLEAWWKDCENLIKKSS